MTSAASDKSILAMFSLKLIADFELKEAYIEGAKSARAGVDCDHNPFEDDAKRANWAKGHRAAATGYFEPVSYLAASVSNSR